MEERWLIGGPAPAVEVPALPIRTPAPACTVIGCNVCADHFCTGCHHEGTYEGMTEVQWREAGQGDPRVNLCAELAKRDGTWIFPCLFDLEGNMVPDAVWLKTKSGKWVWRIGRGPVVTWFNPSTAVSAARRRAFDESRGFRVGSVRRRATIGTIIRRHNIGYYVAPVDDNGPCEIIDDGTMGLSHA